MRSPSEYVQAGDHLPPFLKDFHDQKDLFKTIHRMYGGEESAIKMPEWTTGQCYVIDWFLWFLGQRGWTLQRSRAKVEFRDLDADVAASVEEMRDEFAALLRERRQGAAP